jgi:hypothetical protein
MARYAIASQFLSQLPPDGIERVDLTEHHEKVMNEWRGGSPAAEDAWHEAGLNQQRLEVSHRRERLEDVQSERQGDKETRRRGEKNGELTRVYVQGMLVRHDTYGQGRVTQVSGYGVGCKIRVRFSTHGEKTFMAEKAKLAILGKSS